MTTNVKNGKISERKSPFYQTVDDFRIPAMFSPEAFRSGLAYKPRPDDLFIVTYPRCGTTWVQNIVACIFRGGKPFESGLQFLTQTPFLQMAGAEGAEKMRRPGAIKVHLPFQSTPWSPEAKYIFVARNPKEALEKDQSFLFNVIKHSSFEFMREHLNKQMAEVQNLPKDLIKNNPDIPAGVRDLFSQDNDVFKKKSSDVTFVRKGVTGDWKNYFSQEQSAKLDKKFKERMGNTELAEIWKDVM